ncbi:MAG TPA: hypothetical protein VGM27_18070 [Acidobacteriaceae bacterium]|jgi:hypothetical protein
MPTLATQKDFRAVQTLPFCYVCGREFEDGDNINRDHLPPQNTFAKRDRIPALWLPTHYDCNAAYKLLDEKIGQLISLKRYYQPSSPRHRRLRFSLFPRQGLGAVINVDVDGAIWRWIRGFHAALYRRYMPETQMRALVTPLPRARNSAFGPVFDPLLPQHRVAVELIKTNRAKRNLDSIKSNNSKFTYECVWQQSDDKRAWACFFAMDIYQWKDLGGTGVQPSRGCAGLYILPSGQIPAAATQGTSTAILAPNLDPLDPFGL